MWVMQLAVTSKHVMDCMEEQEGLDSKAQQSRLNSKQFARINLITIAYRAHATKQKDGANVFKVSEC